MKRGISIAMNTIVMITIAIIVLIFVAIWFSGAGGTLFGRLAGVVSGTDVDMANITNATKGVMTGNY